MKAIAFLLILCAMYATGSRQEVDRNDEQSDRFPIYFLVANTTPVSCLRTPRGSSCLCPAFSTLVSPPCRVENF